MPMSRRLFLSGLALPLLPGRAGASGTSGRVVAVTGTAEVALAGGPVVPLTPGMILPEGSVVQTRADGLTELALDDGTRIHAGRDTQVVLQGRADGSDAAVTMVGLAVVDRRTADAGPALKVSGEGFDVELAGAQVFIASLQGQAGADSVFVREGAASVRADGAVILLAMGEGVDLSPPPFPGTPPAPAQEPDGAAPAPAPPTALPPRVPPAPRPPLVARWADDRVQDAFASVGLTT